VIARLRFRISSLFKVGLIIILCLFFFVVCVKADVYVFSVEWGTQGSNQSQFNQPYGIAVDQEGNVYVSDYQTDSIQKFSSTGTFLLSWGQTGANDGEFNSPCGICVDESGNVYVADMENNRIQVFNSNGAFIFSFGSQGNGYSQLGRPAGVAVDKNGNIFVTEQDNARVQKFTSAGVYEKMWGSQGSSTGQFYMPSGIACDQNGNVYVADSSNNRIQKFTSDGSFITSWGSSGNDNGQFSVPSGLTVDKSNHIFVADKFNGRIQEFDSSGKFLLMWGNSGSRDGQFNDPQGVAADKLGNVYVADTYNYRVQKFVLSSATVPNSSSAPSPTNSNAQKNAFPNFEAFFSPMVVAAIIFISFFFAVWWLLIRIPPPGILGSGWQFYLYPTNQEPPGTIFRINKAKEKFGVTQINVAPRASNEAPGKHEQTNTTTLGVLLRFNKANNMTWAIRGKQVQHLNFEMENARGEELYDEDIDPLVRAWTQKHKCDIRPGNRYFIIRKTISTKMITYELTREQTKLLKQKTNLGTKILEYDGNVSTTGTEHHKLPQKFDEEMRIMFIAEEIELREANAKTKPTKPIKGKLSYKEGKN
jgi:DNA-binding beta-propeller fold protein YncE